MADNNQSGTWYFADLVTFRSVDLPASAIANVNVSPTAAISASKLQQHYKGELRQAGNSVDAEEVVHIVLGLTGTVQSFTVAALTDPDGSSIVTFDLKKNGVSILDDVVTINSATGDLIPVPGLLADATVTENDVFTIEVNSTQSGTDALATGVYAVMHIDESYQP